MHKVGEYIIISSCTGRRSNENIRVCNISGSAQEKRKKDRLKLSLPPKLMKKLVWNALREKKGKTG
jgi:hypothetical protein